MAVKSKKAVAQLVRQQIIKSKKRMGIALDIGCGPRKQNGFVGMDIQDIPGVDIVHDCESVPYPLPKECCNMVLLSHLVEHMCPKNVVKVMNEIWRIMKVGGQLVISMPYAASRGFWQDPTHCHAWNEGTAVYFDPHPPKYMLNKPENEFFATYNPKPWKIVRNSWFETGNIEIILEKRPLSDI